MLSVRNAAGNEITNENNIGLANPLRYRGYVYDNETKLYNCNSRYYNPQLRRFINSDAYVSTGTGFLGYNMYTYCNNNPVMHSDPSGNVVTDWDMSQPLSEREYKTLLACTRDWENATTQSDRKAAHAKAVKIRSPYLSNGEFVGGNGYVYCDITYRLNYAMYIHSQEIKTIQNTYSTSIASREFVDKVWPGHEWDLKRTWNLNPYTIYIYEGAERRFDDVGNIHYGYVGAVVFSLPILKGGGGFAQIIAGTSNLSYISSWFDDPHDSAMIEVGYYLYHTGMG